MDIVTILVALLLVFVAWKVVTGVLKYGVILLIMAGAVWYLTKGGM